MLPIKILPEDLINKIAAGEVVERPASVVKELVENAIDAGATKITIEIQGAGSKFIRVADNGIGMSKEELRLSIERHSTSKISTLENLFDIHTLGFRGEALPSIAAVSRMELVSRKSSQSEGEEAGSQLKVDGGKIGPLEDAGCPSGTTVTIKDLFFNTPARKKFLKSPATEMGHISNIIAKYALAYPQIAFELISDGKTFLYSPGSGKLSDAVIAVYGVDLLKELEEVNFASGALKVYGLTSRPTLTRIDKSYETFFVNQRYVQNFLLNRALEDAYRTLIPNGRYPATVLFIDIDPKLVDVNVHPTKREVKFAKNQEVMEVIRSAIAQTLQVKLSATTNPAYSKWDPPCQRFLSENQGTSFSSHKQQENVWSPEMAEILFPGTFEVSSVMPLIPVTQFKNTYLITTDGEDLVLIDQHAAHERILYDRLTKQANNTQKESEKVRQVLLLPETVELNGRGFAAAEANLNYLNSLGFDLEVFGKKSLLLRAVPAIASKISPRQLLEDIITEIDSWGKSLQTEVKQENLRKLIACHSAIKAGDKLSSQEINQLIKDLYATDNPLTCPHGRPTMFRLTEEEIKKRFAR